MKALRLLFLLPLSILCLKSTAQVEDLMRDKNITFPMDGYDYLGFIQNWYWDESKKRLGIWLSATSILKDVNDSEGNRMFRRPLFYRRTDD